MKENDFITITNIKEYIENQKRIEKENKDKWQK